MREQDPAEKFAAHRPRKGHLVTYKGRDVGHVTRVEGTLCWIKELDGECRYGDAPFIWASSFGLNTLHDWPTKAHPRAESTHA